MLVSFIVTSYNYSKYISETIKSLENQTISNFEIIIVDDNSTDDSLSAIENARTSAKVIRHSENKGQLGAIITGLREALGEYVCIIDSDDTVAPNYAERMLEHMTNNDVALCVCNYEFNRIITPKTHTFGGWWWQPMSCGMFRKSALDCVLSYQNAGAWRICADKFLFNLAHLQGNSMLVTDVLVNKRNHAHNAGNGRFRWLINIKNNFIIRHEALKIVRYKHLRSIIKKSYLFLVMQIIEKLDNILSFKKRT